MEKFWHLHFIGNLVSDWAIAIGIIVFGIVASRLIKKIVLIRFRKFALSTKSQFDDYVINATEQTIMPFLVFLLIYLGLRYLEWPSKAERVIYVAFLFILVFFVIKLINSFFSYIFQSVSQDPENTRPQVKAARGILIIIKILLWVLGIIFLIDNLGYNITTLITGLGIGGIAIALASQAVLGDLFSYLVIFFDKPFEVGDFIVAGDKSGVVEYIGIKTTRLRTLDGEQLIISNTDLTNSRVQNYKRMEKRRVVIKTGVPYETSSDKLKKIPQIARSILESQQNVKFDRAHLSSFGDFAINFEFVFYLLSPDYVEFMDVQQQFLLKLKEQFENSDIEFAYPTSKILLKPEESLKHVID